MVSIEWRRGQRHGGVARVSGRLSIASTAHRSIVKGGLAKHPTSYVALPDRLAKSIQFSSTFGSPRPEGTGFSKTTVISSYPMRAELVLTDSIRPGRL